MIDSLNEKHILFTIHQNYISIETDIMDNYLLGHVELVCRGIQYMHCVMHKCIMVKVRGETKNK